jgi:histidine triad (HIT) family protein
MESETQKSQTLNTQEENTIFHKILRKQIPSSCVYEDEKVYAFRDVNPQAPVHIIIIPKEMQGLNMLQSAQVENVPILGYLLYSAAVIARQENLENGYRIVINNGKEGCQSVNYIHIHLLGGAQFGWPPGTNK